MSFAVKTATFEGPLDLLLDLIEKRKLFVGEVSLSQVTDDYLKYVSSLTTESLEEKTNFLLVATTLILIKSRALLPNIELTEEESKEVVELEGRLDRYSHVKTASKYIQERFGKYKLFGGPKERNKTEIKFRFDERLTTELLKDLTNEVLKNIPKEEPELPKVKAEKVMSIEEMITSFETRIMEAAQTSFRKLTGHNGKVFSKQERTLVIVSFLAMLELVRQGIVNVVQDNHFDDILIEKQDKEEFNQEKSYEE